MHLLADHKPRKGLRVIRTDTMAEDEHTYAYWESGAFWEYGEGFGLRLRREVMNVVAWRNLTDEERRWVRQQQQEEQAKVRRPRSMGQLTH